jgi:hypothetical protein
MNEEAEHLTWNVVQRLDDLENIRTWLEKSDDDEQIPNVDAIMNAYTRGDLEWHAGLVTYWSNGEQLCQPRPFKWDEFQAIGAKHKDHIGFWVEGVRRVFRYDVENVVTNEPDTDNGCVGSKSWTGPSSGDKAKFWDVQWKPEWLAESSITGSRAKCKLFYSKPGVTSPVVRVPNVPSPLLVSRRRPPERHSPEPSIQLHSRRRCTCDVDHRARLCIPAQSICHD